MDYKFTINLIKKEKMPEPVANKKRLADFICRYLFLEIDTDEALTFEHSAKEYLVEIMADKSISQEYKNTIKSNYDKIYV